MVRMSEPLNAAEDFATPVVECANRFAIFSECPHCGGSLQPRARALQVHVVRLARLVVATDVRRA